MNRRDARARILVAQTRLRALDTQLGADVHVLRQRVRPGWLLAGGFTAGFSTILLPRRIRLGMIYALGSIAWPLTRVFGPTLLQNFLKPMDDPD